jgi:copper chaperone CopZ
MNAKYCSNRFDIRRFAMDRREVLLWSLSIAGTAFLSNRLTAATPSQPSGIFLYVQDMHCGDCAKRISSKLYAVPGVMKVSTNIKKNEAHVTVQKNKSPSPRLLWDAAIAAQLHPVKLVSPAGTFTQRPKK